MTTLKLPRSAGEPSPADGETVTAERDKRDHDREHKREDNGVESRDVEAAAREAESVSRTEAPQLVNTGDKGYSRTRGEDGQTPRRRGRYLRRRR